MWAHVLLQEHQNHNQLLNKYRQEDAGTYQKKYPTSKEKEETTVDGRRGTIMIKSNPIPTIGWPSNWRTIIPKKFSHFCEGSEPHIRLPSLETWQKDWEFPGNLTLKTKGFDYKTSTGDWGRLQTWRVHAKRCLHQDSEERSTEPTGDWSKTTSQCCRVSCGVGDWQGLITGIGHQSGKVPLGINSFGGHHQPDHRDHRPKGWVISGQKTTKEGVQPLPSADNWIKALLSRASQVALLVKNSPTNAQDLRDVGLSPELGRSPGEGNGNPLQYSCLENPTDRGVWRATVQRVTKNQTQLMWRHTWARPCPPAQDPVFPTTSPSHQEAKTSS